MVVHASTLSYDDASGVVDDMKDLQGRTSDCSTCYRRSIDDHLCASAFWRNLRRHNVSTLVRLRSTVVEEQSLVLVRFLFQKNAILIWSGKTYGVLLMQRYASCPISTPCSSNMALTHRTHLHTSAITADDDDDKRKEKNEEPKGLLNKFRALWRQYWYVVLPVHIVTSIGWFGGFYYVVVSGFDMIAFLESLSFVPDSVVNVLHKVPPAAGSAALAYALYKVASPVRYAVTIAGTTATIRILSQRGLIPTATEVRSRATDAVRSQHARWRERRAELRGKISSRQRAGARLKQKRHGHGHGHRSLSTVASTRTTTTKSARRHSC